MKSPKPRNKAQRTVDNNNYDAQLWGEIITGNYQEKLWRKIISYYIISRKSVGIIGDTGVSKNPSQKFIYWIFQIFGVIRLHLKTY